MHIGLVQLATINLGLSESFNTDESKTPLKNLLLIVATLEFSMYNKGCTKILFVKSQKNDTNFFFGFDWVLLRSLQWQKEFWATW